MANPAHLGDILTYGRAIKAMMRNIHNWRYYDEQSRRDRELTLCSWASVRVDLQITAAQLATSSAPSSHSGLSFRANTSSSSPSTQMVVSDSPSCPRSLIFCWDQHLLSQANFSLTSTELFASSNGLLCLLLASSLDATHKILHKFFSLWRLSGIQTLLISLFTCSFMFYMGKLLFCIFCLLAYIFWSVASVLSGIVFVNVLFANCVRY